MIFVVGCGSSGMTSTSVETHRDVSVPADSSALDDGLPAEAHAPWWRCGAWRPPQPKLGPCPAGSRRVEETRDGERHEGCVDATGERHGPWLFHHAWGPPRLEAHYVHGKPHGHWRAWYDNGVRYFEGAFAHGSPEGTWATFYPSGSRRLSGQFDEAGMQHGTWLRFSPEDIVAEYEHGRLVEGTPVDPAGDYLTAQRLEATRLERDRVHIAPLPADVCPIVCPSDSDWVHEVVAGPRYANAGVRQSCMRVQDRTYVAVGTGVDWVPKEGTTAHRVRTEWKHFPNGRRWVRAYHPNGKLHWFTAHAEHDKDGPHAEYHPSGALKVRGAYLADTMHGPWHRFHDNGQPRDVASYDRGRPVGDHVMWDEAGEVVMRTCYEAFVLHGPYFVSFGEDREVEGEYRRGKQHGRWILRDRSHRREGVYDNGVLVEGDHVGPPEG